jgi:hypothetical protein
MVHQRIIAAPSPPKAKDTARDIDFRDRERACPVKSYEVRAEVISQGDGVRVKIETKSTGTEETFSD